MAAEKLRQLAEQFDKQRTELDEANSRPTSLAADIQAQIGRLDAALSRNDQRFSDLQESRNTAFHDAQTERAEQWKEEVRELEEKRDAALKELRDSAQSALAALEADKAKSAKLLGIISERGLGHGYQKVANEERTTSRFWHGIAIGSMLGLIGFAIAAFVATLTDTSLEWPKVAGRIFVAATFGIATAYAARQADKHRDAERRNRRLELELAALDPFIAPLEAKEQIEVKKKLVDKLFGQSDPTPMADAKTTGTVADLARMAIEALRDVAKK
jgi:hypothetical protein